MVSQSRRQKMGIAAAATALAGYFAFPYVETAKPFYSVTGIDVSHHQGAVDWSAVGGRGVQFAYIKATEGGDFVDPMFQANWNGAKQGGVPYGAYHFFTQCKSGEAQAHNFIATVPLDADALPPVLDAEHMGPCANGAQFDPFVELEEFLQMAEQHFGCRPIVYTTPEFYRNYLAGKTMQERFWLRSIFIPPWYETKNWIFWQYHFAGRRTGVTGPIDLNAFRGTQPEFDAFRREAHCADGQQN